MDCSYLYTFQDSEKDLVVFLNPVNLLMVVLTLGLTFCTVMITQYLWWFCTRFTPIIITYRGCTVLDVSGIVINASELTAKNFVMVSWLQIVPNDYCSEVKDNWNLIDCDPCHSVKWLCLTVGIIIHIRLVVHILSLKSLQNAAFSTISIKLKIKNIRLFQRQAFNHHCDLHQVWEQPSITAVICVARHLWAHALNSEHAQRHLWPMGKCYWLELFGLNHDCVCVMGVG